MTFLTQAAAFALVGGSGQEKDLPNSLVSEVYLKTFEKFFEI